MTRTVFAIPSYHRPGMQHFAKYLHQLGVSREDILIGVQDAQDRRDYEKSVGKIARIVYSEGGGVSFNRNQLLREEPDARMWQMDDVTRRIIVHGRDGFNPVETAERLYRVLNAAWDHAVRNGASVVGLAKSSNTFYTTTNEYIDHPQVMMNIGFIRRMPAYNESLQYYEDLERACRILRCGGRTMVLDFIIGSRTHHNKGGCFDAYNATEKRERTLLMLDAMYKDRIRGGKAIRGTCTVRKCPLFGRI